jgi:hypothetical protein
VEQPGGEGLVVNATEWVALAGNGVVLVAAILGFLSTRSKVQQVHTLVNSRSDKQDRRIDQLTATLTDADIRVPPKPNGTPR